MDCINLWLFSVDILENVHVKVKKYNSLKSLNFIHCVTYKMLE